MDIPRYDRDDELIARTVLTGQPDFKVYIPEGISVVLGRGSRLEREVNLEACQRDRIPLLQREGGGCAVVLDPGNLVVSVVLPMDGYACDRRWFAALADWVLAGLLGCGVSGVVREGTSDLVFQGRKVGGGSLRRTRGYLYYSTTVLVKPRVDLMERYLLHPPREPQYRRGRSHRDFVGAVPASHLGQDPQVLEGALGRHLDRKALAGLVKSVDTLSAVDIGAPLTVSWE